MHAKPENLHNTPSSNVDPTRQQPQRRQALIKNKKCNNSTLKAHRHYQGPPSTSSRPRN